MQIAPFMCMIIVDQISPMGNIRSHWQCRPPPPPHPLVWGSCKFPQPPRCRHQTGKQEEISDLEVRCSCIHFQYKCDMCQLSSHKWQGVFGDNFVRDFFCWDSFSRNNFSQDSFSRDSFLMQIGSPHSPAWLASACPPPGSWSCSRRPHLVADPLVAWDKNLTYSGDLRDWTCCSCCLHLMNRFLPGMGRSNNK